MGRRGRRWCRCRRDGPNVLVTASVNSSTSRSIVPETHTRSASAKLLIENAPATSAQNTFVVPHVPYFMAYACSTTTAPAIPHETYTAMANSVNPQPLIFAARSCGSRGRGYNTDGGSAAAAATVVVVGGRGGRGGRDGGGRASWRGADRGAVAVVAGVQTRHVSTCPLIHIPTYPPAYAQQVIAPYPTFPSFRSRRNRSPAASSCRAREDSKGASSSPASELMMPSD